MVCLSPYVASACSRNSLVSGNMPVHFETPMFWSEEERQELVGTDIESEYRPHTTVIEVTIGFRSYR